MMVLETTIERRLRDAVVNAGGLCIKLPAQWYRGIPDRMILMPRARIYFIELKRCGGKASVHQRKWKRLLFTLGFNSLIIEGEMELKEFIHNELQTHI